MKSTNEGTMEKQKHTPGPWKVTQRNEGDYRIVKEQFENSLLIAQVWGQATETEANAALIAASPEMLSALKEVQSKLEDMTSPLSNLDKGRRMHCLSLIAVVLDKAEGR